MTGRAQFRNEIESIAVGQAEVNDRDGVQTRQERMTELFDGTDGERLMTRFGEKLGQFFAQYRFIFEQDKGRHTASLLHDLGVPGPSIRTVKAELHTYFSMLLRILLFLFLLCGIAHAQPPILLDRSVGVIPLDGQMAWLIDAGGHLQVQQAATAAGWQPLPGSPNAGFTSDAIWLRFQVVQTTDAPSWRLELRNTLLEDVRFFQPDVAGEWHMQMAGRNIKHSAWPLDTRSPTFRLDLPPGRHEIMLRLASRSSLSTGLRLWEAERYYASARDDALLWGGYFGLYGLGRVNTNSNY